MSLVNSFETDLLELIFENTDLANIGDATGLRGSSTAGTFSIALFTADPGEAGSVANEATYTSYDRVDIARSGAAWVVSGNNCSNAAAVTFPAATGGSSTVTYFGIMEAGTPTTSDMIMYGALSASLAITSGITPEFAIGELDINVD